MAGSPVKPRLLVLASTFRTEQTSSHPGFINELCRHLQAENDITVLTQHNPGQSFSEEIENITVTRYRYAPDRFEILSASGGIANTIKTRPLSALLVPALIVTQTIAIWRLLRNDPPYLIHAHWIIPQGFCVVIARALSKHKPRIILTSHGGDLYGLKGAMFKSIKRFVLGRVDRFCVVSQSMKSYTKEILGLLDLKIDVCPMGADLESTFTPPKDDSQRKNGQLLFVGRLVEKKGLQFLIESIPKIIRAHPHVCLVVAGDGPLRAELENLCQTLGIGNQVSFRGSVAHQDLPELYRSCEVAVFPFVQAKGGDMEGLGLVVVEAMGSGAAVVAGNVPAVHDTIENGETGLLCNPKDLESLEQSISSLLGNRAKRKKLADSALKHVKKHYTWTTCARNYQDIFDSLSE